ncbi:dehydrogenase/reductase SDR family member 4-like [Gigantopelta aegis]|uniref:dehydrogenase/reductase SDR family member 4-like n=1 Tax=Gigantopelta aegis TaxID=1735272 RepID=UPI001B887B5E|nr:dehydrogenase/reductase SDR family member 4-like [Gigantopelta aegis]
MSINSTRKFEGKVAVVTASTDGIGYAIANRLAYDGAKVMVSSRKGANVKRAVELLQKEHGSESVSGVVCHVGKDEDRKSLIKEVIKQFGQIDILVDNAAVNPSPGKLLHLWKNETYVDNYIESRWIK